MRWFRLASVLTRCHDRCVTQVLIAESYGGRDEPVDALVGNFVDVGLPPPFDPLRVKGTPTERTYQEYEEAGTDLAQLLTQKVLSSLDRTL